MNGNNKIIHGYLSLFTIHPDEEYVNSYRVNKALIQAMAKYCGDNDIKFMLVCCDININREKLIYLTDIDPTFNLKYIENDMLKR